VNVLCAEVFHIRSDLDQQHSSPNQINARNGLEQLQNSLLFLQSGQQLYIKPGLCASSA